MVDRKKLKVEFSNGCLCNVLWFSMHVKNHQRGPNVHFYRIGIGDGTTTKINSREWQLASLDVLTRKFNESEVRKLFYSKLNFNVFN